MAIVVPRARQESGGGINWFVSDPVAQAQALRAQRRAEALGMIGQGLKRGASNYMKGGLHGVIDPEFANQQQQADLEGAQLEARLGSQYDKAAAESKQPTETGSQSVDPATGSQEKKPITGSALGESTDSWLSKLGQVGKAVWRGPGTHYDIKEVARNRGRLQGIEDRRKDVEAIGQAIKYQKDPGALIGQVYREGLGSIKPGQLQGEQEKISPQVKTINWYRELQRAGGDETKMDLEAVRQADLADERRAEADKQAAIAANRPPEKERAPTAAESEDATIQRLRTELASPDPAVRHRAKRELQLRRIVRPGGRQGAGSTATADKFARVDEQAAAVARQALGREPDPQEIILFRGKRAGTEDTAALAAQLNDAKAKREAAQAHPQSGGNANQNVKPDVEPAQHDSRGGEIGKNPGNRPEQRHDQGGQPDDDVPIYKPGAGRAF